MHKRQWIVVRGQAMPRPRGLNLWQWWWCECDGRVVTGAMRWLTAATASDDSHRHIKHSRRWVDQPASCNFTLHLLPHSSAIIGGIGRLYRTYIELAILCPALLTVNSCWKPSAQTVDIINCHRKSLVEEGLTSHSTYFGHDIILLQVWRPNQQCQNMERGWLVIQSGLMQSNQIHLTMSQ